MQIILRIAVLKTMYPAISEGYTTETPLDLGLWISIGFLGTGEVVTFANRFLGMRPGGYMRSDLYFH